MPYATPDDMSQRYGAAVMIALTDLERSGALDSAAALVALEDASAEIDGYLGRYRLPFSAPPPQLRVLCCDIARCRLATGMRQMSEEVQLRYESAISYLKLVATGRAQLAGISSAAAPESDDGAVFNSPQAKVFGRDQQY